MILTKSQICKLLDISSAFLFLNSSKISKKKKEVIGKFKIPRSHWIFSAHLISDPMFPGVFLVEAMCQTAMLMIYLNLKKNSPRGVLRSVDITFKNPVKRKTTPLILRTEAKEISSKRGISNFSVKISSFDNKITYAEGSIVHFLPPVSPYTKEEK
jgi:3-hydroxymyristoyl/3-hydroxydecanoyl-(acyl carrier protein) dehydratase